MSCLLLALKTLRRVESLASTRVTWFFSNTVKTHIPTNTLAGYAGWIQLHRGQHHELEARSPRAPYAHPCWFFSNCYASILHHLAVTPPYALIPKCEICVSGLRAELPPLKD